MARLQVVVANGGRSYACCDAHLKEALEWVTERVPFATVFRVPPRDDLRSHVLYRCRCPERATWMLYEAAPWRSL